MKIFLTVGSMLPFDRLVRAVDKWAKDHFNAEVFAQIGETDLRPLNIEYCTMISPSAYRKHFSDCDLVVSHVGMGTIITAAELCKPLLMLPRRVDLQEVTSNHQIDTVKWLEGRPGVFIIYSENDLGDAIHKSIGSGQILNIEMGTRGKLIDKLCQFISD
jgi:UDP-N-acetylglucosamine transferase subunit ALG13